MTTFIIISLYILFGLLSSFTIQIIAHAQEWDDVGRDMATVLGALVWPIALPATLIIAAALAMSHKAEEIGTRMRHNRK